MTTETIPGMIGKWITDTPSVIIIFKAKNQLKMKTSWSNGNSIIEVIQKSTEGKNKRYDSPDGTYYIIEDNNNLKMYHKNGETKEAEKI